MSTRPLLEVRALTTVLDRPGGAVPVIDSVSFDVSPGERVAIVGESGSGKSTTALSMIGLLPRGLRHQAGQVLLDGVDITELKGEQMQAVRGRRVGMVFQDPLHSLDPVVTIGAQIAAVARKHEPHLRRRDARERAVELLADVGFASPAEFMGRYPHQLSGGMRQRAMIAASLAGKPELLVADEPTSALDVTVQAQIIDLLEQLSEERGLAVVLITHDLGLVAGFAHRTVVMYGGSVVEVGATAELFRRPLHPYTEGLLACAPRIDGPLDELLVAIPGNPPTVASLPEGCAFAPRCPKVHDRCIAERPVLQPWQGVEVACHLVEKGVRS